MTVLSGSRSRSATPGGHRRPLTGRDVRGTAVGAPGGAPR
ncbi:hypothetical protein APASM_1328 [Actinosynnema pretiosum subsp. pretiosum]|nr:hypothetical protein APASM_1328 [Actinosynnema pretiosum subsp. pretiosum]